jgi:hypothetical protein
LKESSDALVAVGLNKKVTVVRLVYLVDEVTKRNVFGRLEAAKTVG